MESHPNVFTARLNRLFDVMPGPDGKPFTTDYVATQTGVSRTYLTQLRTGKKAKPSMPILARIAAFFDVPVDYFTDSQAANKLDAELAQLAALRDTGASKLLLRVHGISQESLDAVIQLAESARRMEGLPPVDD